MNSYEQVRGYIEPGKKAATQRATVWRVSKPRDDDLPSFLHSEVEWIRRQLIGPKCGVVLDGCLAEDQRASPFQVTINTSPT